jgi:hypothetical protein
MGYSADVPAGEACGPAIAEPGHEFSSKLRNVPGGRDISSAGPPDFHTLGRWSGLGRLEPTDVLAPTAGIQRLTDSQQTSLLEDWWLFAYFRL